MSQSHTAQFHSRIIVPIAPPGFMVVKFHGLPLVIPEAREGEARYKNSSYTTRQVAYLYFARDILMNRLAAAMEYETTA